MSIFGSIMAKIFHHGEQAAAPVPGPESGVATATPPPGVTASPASPGAPAGSAGAAQAPVDVAAVLNGMAAKAGQTLDWRHSIVDLMKLLGLDSSLAARKELAKELNYSGDTNDSAAMNIWLHKQVMLKLAANGGRVPDDLKG